MAATVRVFAHDPQPPDPARGADSEVHHAVARRAKGLLRKKGFVEKDYHSPLNDISARQVAALQAALDAKRPDTEFRVRLVFEFMRPYIWEFLGELKPAPPGEIVIVPLYMAESDFTSGISRTDLVNFHRAQAGGNPLPAPRFVLGNGFDERFGKVLAGFIARQCDEAGWDEAKTRGAALILGAHGTLQYPPPGINSGARETLHLFGMIRSHLRGRFRTVRIGWLNHKIGGKWTFPE
ncbi:ferrochelatase, partial [Candidatus Poribacteria bacterium]|nr:ferrochelatase [Candidatus Poribacteria bacterium]